MDSGFSQTELDLEFCSRRKVSILLLLCFMQLFLQMTTPLAFVAFHIFLNAEVLRNVSLIEAKRKVNPCHPERLG